MYLTHMLDRLVAARLRASRKSVLLLGARQVGKSTLTRALSPDVVINLADEGRYLEYAKDPARLRRELLANKGARLVLLDEVQRVPTLLNTVQALMDEGLGVRFIFTGSSARKLKRGGANLLPGRIILEHLDPLTIWELGDRFDIERCLQIGCLPGIYLDQESSEDVLASYAAVYLREEIQAESVIRNIGAYARFLDAAALASGDWVNYSKLASDTEIPKETLRRYYQLLEDTLLAFRLPPYGADVPGRRVPQRERVLLFDVGVRNALLGIHGGPLSETEKGKLFEHWFTLQCLYFIRAWRLPWKVFSYRTDAGAEVDLIIDTGKELLAIECKWSKNVRAAQLSGLRSFQAVAAKPVQAFVVFRGERAQRLGNALIVPFIEFLLEHLPSFR
jgi:predicted AAA+ superfamily ATPase